MIEVARRLLFAGFVSVAAVGWRQPHLGASRAVAPHPATAGFQPAQAPAATPTAASGPAGVLLPVIYYQDGATVYAVNRDGSNQTAVATLPPGATFQPVLFPDGRLIYPAGPGFAVVDRYGRRFGLRVPDLNPGESVWSVAPSPDGRALAWQLFAPLSLNGFTTNAGSGRIVLTGRFGDPGRPVLTAQARADDGQTPILVGWRPSSLYSLNGPTLLLQNLYSRGDAATGILANTTRDLLEYDPAVADVVDDYLPALGSAAVAGQSALAVSADGIWTVYGDSYTFTPSGEGPLARALDALDLNTNALRRLDTAGRYPTKGSFVVVTRRTVKKRTVTHRATTTLRLYQYFSRHAYVAPGDGRVLYTLVTVSYPPGALTPRVQTSVLVATMDGRTQSVVSRDAQGQGWLDGHVAVIRTSDGLYAVDVVYGGSTRLGGGAGARFIGTR